MDINIRRSTGEEKWEGARIPTSRAKRTQTFTCAEKHRHAQKERQMERDRLTRKYQYTRPSASRATKTFYIYEC